MDREPTRRAREDERARRPAARELVAAYHDEQLRALLERVREASQAWTPAS